MSILWPGTHEKWFNHVVCHIADLGRVPARGVIFINSQGANTLDRFTGIAESTKVRGVKTMAHHAALHLQVLRQIEVSATADLL
jgi:hypothetical protein